MCHVGGRAAPVKLLQRGSLEEHPPGVMQQGGAQGPPAGGAGGVARRGWETGATPGRP
jgi:hypothetical protein